MQDQVKLKKTLIILPKFRTPNSEFCGLDEDELLTICQTTDYYVKNQWFTPHSKSVNETATTKTTIETAKTTTTTKTP